MQVFERETLITLSRKSLTRKEYAGNNALNHKPEHEGFRWSTLTKVISMNTRWA